MITRLATFPLALLLACSAHEGTAPGSNTPPPVVGSGARPAPPIAEGAAMDLTHAESATAELALTAAAPVTRTIAAPAERTVVLTLRHVGGTVGRIGLTIYDAADPRVPISDDAMTCAEPGCSVKVEVARAAAPRSLIATCTGSAAMTTRLEAALGPAGPSK
ncbi:MAG: hypothetical protein K8W52_37100 [Deltaproteobacteria bacterium]|nr:hypothetical protein [Deltaproteobacteria bacterium]